MLGEYPMALTLLPSKGECQRRGGGRDSRSLQGLGRGREETRGGGRILSPEEAGMKVRMGGGGDRWR